MRATIQEQALRRVVRSGLCKELVNSSARVIGLEYAGKMDRDTDIYPILWNSSWSRTHQ